MSDMFPDELTKELQARVAGLDRDLKIAVSQNRDLLEIYFRFQSMLGDVADKGEITIDSEREWFTRSKKLIDKFDQSRGDYGKNKLQRVCKTARRD